MVARSSLELDLYVELLCQAVVESRGRLGFFCGIVETWHDVEQVARHVEPIVGDREHLADCRLVAEAVAGHREVTRGRIVVAEVQQLGADREVGARLVRGDRPCGSAVVTTEIRRRGYRLVPELRRARDGSWCGCIGVIYRSVRSVRLWFAVRDPEQPTGRAGRQRDHSQSARATRCHSHSRFVRTRSMRFPRFPSLQSGTPPNPVPIGKPMS